MPDSLFSRTTCIIIAVVVVSLSGLACNKPASNSTAPAATPSAEAHEESISAPPGSEMTMTADDESSQAANTGDHADESPVGAFWLKDHDTLRVVSYNILWNNIFPHVNPTNAQRFARVVRALDPDILAMQEIGTHPGDRDKPNAPTFTADDVRKLLNTITADTPEISWHVYQGTTNVIASKYPLSMTAQKTAIGGERRLAMALVDLPDDRYNVDAYILNNHFKSAGGERNQQLRQLQADAIVNHLRDARTKGGNIDLPANTPILVVGDFNIVGGPQPLKTVITGNIIDEKTYGPDFAIDWDSTSLTDAHPTHNRTGKDDYTWRKDSSRYEPGRLDYIIYADSVLRAENSFILNPATMSEKQRTAAGLKPLDVIVGDREGEYDHLPLVVDFTIITPRNN